MELPPVFDDLAERARDVIEEKPVVVAVSAGLTFLALIAVIIVLIQTSPKKAPPEPEAPQFTADAPLFIPDAPVIEQDYYPSRITEKVWSGDDISTWFTTPNEEALKSLEQANDKIIKDITGAAP
ncbi:MAG: hypothetical protein K6G80_03655 [Treponema sp.]|nr:hypothetical protein [Treponema sp.]